MSKGWKLHWNGSAVMRLAEEAVVDIMADAGLYAEGQAKKELRKGHGVVQGTLRRSIHAAGPGHAFGADGTGEQGGQLPEPAKRDGKIVVSVGSGLVYAMAIHQGWSGHAKLKGTFAGYHYLEKGVEKTKAKMPSIVTKHRIKKK